MAGHKLEEIGTIFLNDKPNSLDANGYANCIPYSYDPAEPVANTKTVNAPSCTDEGMIGNCARNRCG